MSIYPVLCNHIALPYSCIKSPGSLLKETDRQHGCKTRQQKIQTLLESFRSMKADNITKISESLMIIQPKQSSTSHLEVNPQDLISYPELANVLKTMKPKVISDELGFLIKKASRILGFYGIELMITVEHDQYSELYNLVRTLVLELSLFSEGFIGKLQIKRFVICLNEEKNFLKPKYNPKNTFFFSINPDVHDITCYACQELYKNILDNILRIKPKLIWEWERILFYSKPCSILEVKRDLETTFMALMKNAKYAMLQSKVEKIKEILIMNFPEEISEEWFKDRNRTKKKLYKVRFCAVKSEVAE